MKLPLSKIANGERAIVHEILASELRVKLMEMGLISGKVLTVLFRAPLGDPIAVDIDGYVLSLRTEEAALVIVEQEMGDK